MLHLAAWLVLAQSFCVERSKASPSKGSSEIEADDVVDRRVHAPTTSLVHLCLTG